MADNQVQPPTPENPLVSMANMLNMMAPHNVLRQFTAGGQMPALPFMPAQQQAPQQQQAQPAAPAQPTRPQGIMERRAARTGQSATELDAYWADKKKKSEVAGFSVEGRTIIF
jgi:hypothetical protein